MQHARVHPVISLGVSLELGCQTRARRYGRGIGSRRHVIGIISVPCCCSAVAAELDAMAGVRGWWHPQQLVHVQSGGDAQAQTGRKLTLGLSTTSKSTMAAQHPDASDAGRHCTVCQALDFLPFICRACDSPFCRDHADRARIDGHACAAETGSGASETTPHKVSEGSFKDLLPDRSGPVRPEPTPADTLREQKKQAGLALLHKNFPSTSKSASASPPSPASASSSSVPAAKPASTAARKVALMKLKRSAKPGDPRRTDKQVPAPERRYLTVQEASSGMTVDIWLSKVLGVLAMSSTRSHTNTLSISVPQDCSCGKALDLLADALHIRNRNNDAATPASEVTCAPHQTRACG